MAEVTAVGTLEQELQVDDSVEIDEVKLAERIDKELEAADIDNDFQPLNRETREEKPADDAATEEEDAPAEKAKADEETTEEETDEETDEEAARFESFDAFAQQLEEDAGIKKDELLALTMEVGGKQVPLSMIHEAVAHIPEIQNDMKRQVQEAQDQHAAQTRGLWNLVGMLHQQGAGVKVTSGPLANLVFTPENEVGQELRKSDAPQYLLLKEDYEKAQQNLGTQLNQAIEDAQRVIYQGYTQRVQDAQRTIKGYTQDAHEKLVMPLLKGFGFSDAEAFETFRPEMGQFFLQVYGENGLLAENKALKAERDQLKAALNGDADSKAPRKGRKINMRPGRGSTPKAGSGLSRAKKAFEADPNDFKNAEKFMEEMGL